MLPTLEQAIEARKKQLQEQYENASVRLEQLAKCEAWLAEHPGQRETLQVALWMFWALTDTLGEYPD